MDKKIENIHLNYQLLSTLSAMTGGDVYVDDLYMDAIGRQKYRDAIKKHLEGNATVCDSYDTIHNPTATADELACAILAIKAVSLHEGRFSCIVTKNLHSAEKYKETIEIIKIIT